jgi:hypothetical protein
MVHIILDKMLAVRGRLWDNLSNRLHSSALDGVLGVGAAVDAALAISFTARE